MTLRSKLWFGVALPALIGLIALYLVTSWSLRDQKESSVETVRSLLEQAAVRKLRGQVDVAARQLERCFESQRDKPVPEAQATCAETLRKLRFGDGHKSYFWIHSLTPDSPLAPKMIMHPVLGNLNGKDVSDFVDKKRFRSISYRGTVYAATDPAVRDIPAVNLFVDMNRSLMASRDGTAVVRYYWPDPARSTEIGYAKISCIAEFKPWGWVVGTGEYVDNIESIVREQSRVIESAASSLILSVSEIAAVITLALFALCYLISENITRRLQQITAAVRQMAVGDFEVRLRRGGDDEVGRVADAFSTIAESQLSKATLAHAIARGDLRQEVVPASERDQLGQALKAMTDELRVLVKRIRRSFHGVAERARDIHGASQGLSEGAGRQAAAIQEISSSTTEIGSQASANAEHAEEANRLAVSARNAAQRGDHEVRVLSSAMAEINGASQQISSIIKTIEEIAFQTNLLALNAAVEAARAGRHGKGFAVVAEEVRSLSSRSAQAAQQTADMIESSARKVQSGLEAAQRVSKVFGEIAGSVVTTASLVSEITIASKEQAQAIIQVAQGLTQIEHVTQTNTSSAQDVSAAGEQLSVSATEVEQLLYHFQLVEDRNQREPAREGRSAVADSTDAQCLGQSRGWAAAQDSKTKRRARL